MAQTFHLHVSAAGKNHTRSCVIFARFRHLLSSFQMDINKQVNNFKREKPVRRFSIHLLGKSVRFPVFVPTQHPFLNMKTESVLKNIKVSSILYIKIYILYKYILCNIKCGKYVTGSKNFVFLSDFSQRMETAQFFYYRITICINNLYLYTLNGWMTKDEIHLLWT